VRRVANCYIRLLCFTVCWQGNLVGAEDADDSDVEIAPDDHELNYGEPHVASGTRSIDPVNSVFNERAHVVNESEVLCHRREPVES